MANGGANDGGHAATEIGALLEKRVSFGVWESSARSTGVYAWLVLLALQPFNQFGALRQLAGLLLLLSLTILGWQALRLRGFKQQRPKPPYVAIGLALVLWAIVASLLGPYPIDSAHELRKGLLVQIMIVAGGLCFVSSVADLRRALAWVLGGFVVVTVLSVGEIGHYWWHNGPSLAVPRSHASWWGGYGSTGACMMSLLVGWLLLQGRCTLGTAAIGAVGLVAVCLILLYWARTPLVVLVSGVCLVLALARRWRSLAATAVAVMAAVALLMALPAQQFDRYQSLLRSETYTSNSGLSVRPALWQGVVEVIRERPLLGYGYGWKKFAWAINDGGFAHRWQAEGGSKAAYFLNGKDHASYGRVNPHNYFLQVTFELGWPGLILALAFWAALLKVGIKMLARTTTGEIRTLAAAILGLAGAYWLSNLTNGHWQGGLANVTLALAAGLAALRRADTVSPA